MHNIYFHIVSYYWKMCKVVCEACNITWLTRNIFKSDTLYQNIAHIGKIICSVFEVIWTQHIKDGTCQYGFQTRCSSLKECVQTSMTSSCQRSSCNTPSADWVCIVSYIVYCQARPPIARGATAIAHQWTGYVQYYIDNFEAVYLTLNLVNLDLMVKVVQVKPS